MKRFIPFLLLVVFLAGCMSTERGVVNPSVEHTETNLFYSEAQPKLKLKVDEQIKYVGKRKKQEFKKFPDGSGSYLLRAEYYVFVQPDKENHVERMVLISLYDMNKGYWLPDLFGRVKNPLENKITKINNENYHTALWVAGPTNQPWTEVVENRGYIIDDLGITKSLGRRVGSDNQLKIYIYYIEDIKRCGNGGFAKKHHWVNPDYLLEQQKQFIKAFKQRADEAIQFLP